MNIESIVESIHKDLESCAAFQVAVFWLEEAGDRDKVVEDLNIRFKGSRVVAHVLRRHMFVDPNAWAADAMEVINSLREQIEVVGDGCLPQSPLGIVIVARNKLTVAQSSSPAVAPDWLPVIGGSRIMVVARDLQAMASCSLAARETASDSVKLALYEMEVALLRIAQKLASSDRHHGQRLWGEVLKERSGLERKGQFVDYWRSGLEGVTDASSYRPSLAFGWSMVSALWDTFLKSSPSQLLTKSEAFVEYFDIRPEWLPSPPLPVPLLPILFRGAGDFERSASAVTGRSLVLLVGVACQLVTAAAHADQYGRVNSVALDAMSKEIRLALSVVEQRANWAAEACTIGDSDEFDLQEAVGVK